MGRWSPAREQLSPSSDENGWQGGAAPFGTVTLAHDLRTALSALVSGLEVLIEQPEVPSARAERLLAVARRNILWLGDLLEAATAHDGSPVALERHSVDVRSLAADVVTLFAPVLVQRGQRVEIDSPSRPVLVLANRGHLCRILLNLLDNASKFGPDGDVIRIVMRRRRKGLVVSVCDHGPGIPPGHRRSIFRAYHRAAPPPRGGPRGSGLGLALVRSLVEEQGGSVGVSFRSGETRVWLYLPQEIVERKPSPRGVA